MCPLVNLVGHHSYSAERESTDRNGAAPQSFDWNSKEAEEHRNRQKGRVAVGVDEAPLKQIAWIDMMHTEGNEKAVPDYGEIIPAPGIRAPVNQPGRQIGCCNSDGQRQRNPPLRQAEACCDAKSEGSEHQERRGKRQD
jgi:hypothetical protein